MQGGSSVQGTPKQGLALGTPVQANAEQEDYTSGSLRGAASRAKIQVRAKYPTELLQPGYVSKSPDAPRLVITPVVKHPGQDRIRARYEGQASPATY